MKQFHCQFVELDTETRDYLRTVAKRVGNKTPGVFVKVQNYWPVIAFILGPIIGFMGVMVAMFSSKNASAVAMLVTASVLLGGWLFVYAFRRWMAGVSSKFAGFYTYFDPTHVYQVNGEEITVTDISEFDEVSLKHNTSNGQYSSSKLTFNLVNDGRLGVPMKNQRRAEYVKSYYDAIEWLEMHEDKQWRNLPLHELGIVAKSVVASGDVPEELKIDSVVDSLPVEPQKTNRASGGLLPYFAILIAGVAIYFASIAALTPLQDTLAFNDARTRGAPGLRAYLLDDRNTRHRDEAKVLMTALYEPAINRVKTNVKDEAVKARFVEILNSLREAGSPVLSLIVTEKSPPDLQMLAPTRTSSSLTDLADTLGTYIGTELVAFAVPPQDKNAHIELAYAIVPHEENISSYKATWQLRLRTTPDGEAIDSQVYTLPGVYDPARLGQIPNDLKVSLFTELFNQAPPTVVQIPIGGGDFD